MAVSLRVMRDAPVACEQADDGGNLTVTFRGPPGANASACSGAVQWPRLDSLLLLGVGPIDVASLRLQVDTDSGHGLPAHGRNLQCSLHLISCGRISFLRHRVHLVTLFFSMRSKGQGCLGATAS